MKRRNLYATMLLRSFVHAPFGTTSRELRAPQSPQNFLAAGCRLETQSPPLASFTRSTAGFRNRRRRVWPRCRYAARAIERISALPTLSPGGAVRALSEIGNKKPEKG